MNTVLKYVIGLDLLNCHAKIHGNTISRYPENDIVSCYFWQFSGYFRTEIVTSVVGYGQPDVMLLNCMSCRVTFPVLFFSLKPEMRHITVWIELAAPYTFANHYEISSNHTLPFIIFPTPISCDGSNCIWHRCLLLLPCSL